MHKTVIQFPLLRPLLSQKDKEQKMANLCSRDCATTESQTIPLWKRRYPKQGSYVGRARQAQGVYPEYPGAATLHSLSWDPSSLTLILIFRHLSQL